MKNRILILASLGIALLFTSGCATLIGSQLLGKMPAIQAETLTVTVNVAGVGGGTIETKGVTNDGVTLKAAEYHEQINTPTGSLKIDGTNVSIPAKK